MAVRKLRDQIKEATLEKERRYAGYQVLVGTALEAAGQAVLDYVAVPAGQRRRGAVWVALPDGRSSFAHFLRESGDPRWKRGNKQMGTYLPVNFPDLDKALAWARAFRDVLADGEVAVTVEYRLISGRRDDG